jgi:hypothetical protein
MANKLVLDTERLLLAEAAAHITSAYRLIAGLARDTRKKAYLDLREGLYLVEEMAIAAQLSPAKKLQKRRKRRERVETP